MAGSPLPVRRYGSTSDRLLDRFFLMKTSVDRLSRPSYPDLAPAGEGEVIEVFFAPFIRSVGNIDEKALTVDVEIEVSLRWSDPSAIESYTDGKGKTKYKVKEELLNKNNEKKPWKDEIWTPNLVIDETKDQNDGHPEEIYSWEVVRDPKTEDPMLQMYMRFAKTVKQKFMLRAFPFERFNLTIFFTLDDQNDKEAVLKLSKPEMFLDCSMCFGDVSGESATSGSDPYKIMDARIVPDICTEAWSRVMVKQFRIKEEDDDDIDFDLTEFSNLELRLDVARKPFFYIAKILSVMILAMLIGASTFAISPEELGDRLAQGITIFLTLVAFQFAVSTDLPQLPYLTTLDKVNIVTYFLVTLSMFENVAVASIQSSDIVQTIETLSLVSYLSGIGLTLAWLIVRATKSLSTVPKEFEYRYHETCLTKEEVEEIKTHPKFKSLWVKAPESPDRDD